MSAVSLFSYFILLIVLILNSIKIKSGFLSLHLFHALIFSYIGFCAYFTNLVSDDLFSILIFLLYLSYFTLFLGKRKKFNTSHLFINVALILLPVLLLLSQTFWEIFVLVVILELMRIISDSGNNERKTITSFLNFINSYSKIFFLLISFVSAFLITGSAKVMTSAKIQNDLIAIPVMLMLMNAFLFAGGINSKIVEQVNLLRYKSKNILAYLFIYQFLIPFALIRVLREILSTIAYDIYVRIALYSNVFACISIIYIIYQIIKTQNILYRANLYKCLVYVPLFLIYIFSNVNHENEILFYGFFIAIVQTINILCVSYKVKSRNIYYMLSSFVFYLTPLSPFFYILINDLDEVDVFIKNFLSVITYSVIVISNYLYISMKHLEFGNMGTPNKFATKRVVYLTFGLVMTVAILAYEKI